MSEHEESVRNKHILGANGEKFAPIRSKRQVGETGARPSAPGCGKTHPKLLKRRRLLVFQFGLEMPLFRQAKDWPKWETLWAIVGALPERCTARGVH
jgi:hypothetical protein